MGKKRHSKDRMFITMTEHKWEWGGKKDAANIPMAKLPFFCCSLSLMPFENPVCSPDGIVFDIVNIVPFIKKYRKNPVTGDPLKIPDLIKLNFHKNSKGEYHDPISFKLFTEFTYIVAIKTSGNVYGNDTVEELNKKPKFWRDLLTDEEFTFKDIIILQEPTNIEKRTVSNFDYIKKEIVFEPVNEKDKEQEKKDNQPIVHSASAKRILAEINDSKRDINDIVKKKLHVTPVLEKDKLSEVILNATDEKSTNFFIKECILVKKLQHRTQTTANVTSAITSTSFDPTIDNALRVLTESEVRKLYYEDVREKKKKGYAQLVTNLGSLNIQLYCDLIPRACENFLELCEKRYFDNTKFHRVIKYFMMQGGDPTGTGKGGESIYGKPFEDEFHPKYTHNKAGVISMANSGMNTNKSQFFITLSGESTHLDRKHTVFGEVVGGLSILDFVNSMEIDTETEKPMMDIIIFSTSVIKNPFRESIEFLKEEEHKRNNPEYYKKLEDEKNSERWISTNSQSFSLPNKNKDKNSKVEIETKREGLGLASSLLDEFASLKQSKN